jgi:hypothetical protein
VVPRARLLLARRLLSSFASRPPVVPGSRAPPCVRGRDGADGCSRLARHHQARRHVPGRPAALFARRRRRSARRAYLRSTAPPPWRLGGLRQLSDAPPPLCGRSPVASAPRGQAGCAACSLRPKYPCRHRTDICAVPAAVRPAAGGAAGVAPLLAKRGRLPDWLPAGRPRRAGARRAANRAAGQPRTRRPATRRRGSRPRSGNRRVRRCGGQRVGHGHTRQRVCPAAAAVPSP